MVKEGEVEGTTSDKIQGEKEENNENSLDPEIRFKKLHVIGKDLNAIVEFNKFKSVFSEYGIKLFDNGKLSIINDNIALKV